MTNAAKPDMECYFHTDSDLVICKSSCETICESYVYGLRYYPLGSSRLTDHTRKFFIPILGWSEPTVIAILVHKHFELVAQR